MPQEQTETINPDPAPIAKRAKYLQYLRINIDNDDDDAVDDSLFFFPANNADQHAIINNEWQHWNVADGKVSLNGDIGPGDTTTLAAYATANPAATLVNNNGGQANGGSIATIVGCAAGGNADPFTNGVYYIDRVIVGENGEATPYDFETSASETDAGTVTVGTNEQHLHGWVHSAYDEPGLLTAATEVCQWTRQPTAG